MPVQNLSEEPKSYTGIYSMHKYWSKKPFNVIRKYIETYTDSNDIVLDPFTGSGISNIESILLDRKTIGIDINPMSKFITYQTLQNLNPAIIEKEFSKLKHKTQKTIDEFYQVKRNRKYYTGSHFLYKNDILYEVWYKDKNGKKIIDTPKPSDLKLLKKFTYKGIKTFFPTQKLIANSRINAKDGMSVYDLFTPRNTNALSIILHEINKIQDEKLRNFFKFCFTACLGQASKMVFIVNKRKKMQNKNIKPGRKEVGSWVIGYWVPKERFEINAWNCFENRYNKILKSKKEYYESNYTVTHTKNFKGLKNGDGNILLINQSCHTALQKIPDDSIDYVITDPPHGNRLPYLELSMMWNNWLKFDANMSNELVVSDAKTRDKTVTEYCDLLEKILVQITRVLKPGKYFTLMFNSYDDDTWQNLQEMLFRLNLELTNIGTIGYSAASVIQDSRKGGLKTDFILTFKKKNTLKKKKHKVADKKIVDELIRDYLNNNKDYSLYKILNHVITHLINTRLVFVMSSITSSIAVRFQ